MKHDRDQVKRKALFALHTLLQVDTSISSDVARIMTDKLSYKESSVMMSVLPGLHELIKLDPEPYRGLVHYFTNILKQAAEGKLGRSWVVHRAPAPFLQIFLLRLLALLGAGNAQCSGDMLVVIMDVWRRAVGLASQAGNAILFECMKTATAISPSDTLYSMTLETCSNFLSTTDNNLKCAAIEILSRLIDDGDAGKVQEYQYEIVKCLHSSDPTLKKRTLDLLFQMTGPSNIDVVFKEVLEYVLDSTIDDSSRKSACASLVEVAENFAPSLSWFVECITTMLQRSEGLTPMAAEDSLMKVLKQGSDGTDPAGDLMLRHRTCQTYFEMMKQPKIPSSLLRVICWMLGNYGLEAGLSFDDISAAILDVIESHSNVPELLVVAMLSLSRLSSTSGQAMTLEARNCLISLRRSRYLEVQQVAYEVDMLAR